MASGQPWSASAQQPFASPPPAAFRPQPIQPPAPSASQAILPPPSKQNLKAWWKGFKSQGKAHETQEAQDTPALGPSGIFGVPLRQSITYANVAISLVDADGQSYIYGYVPIVVAKCGVFLKEKATTVEGIFRLSGSEKRIKELRRQFDSPDRYGKGLDWEGYTVHDAANVLRRYLNQLPEPIVPLDLYDRFREPLRGYSQQVLGDQNSHMVPETSDLGKTIAIYQQLITELPPLNRQLMLYILDLLAVFASKSDENRMTSANLAAIFQPGMLSHPNHDMAPDQYRLSQDVLVFLIEHQDQFLIGMRGTAADEKTVKDVQNGGTPPLAAPSTPTQKNHVTVDRSPSNASAGADSIRKQGGVRRNVSVNSRHSRQSNGTPSPASPAFGPPMTHSSSGGVHRSNTVPSRKSPGLSPGRLQKSPGSRSPTSAVSPANALEITGLSVPVTSSVQRSESSASSYGVSPVATGVSSLPAEENVTASGQSQDRLLPDPSELKADPGTPRGLFQRMQTSDSEKRIPNKLKKKRVPSSSDPSAQSSTDSLPGQLDAPAAGSAQAPLNSRNAEQGWHGEQLNVEPVSSANPILSNTEATPPLSEQHQRMQFDTGLLQTEATRSSDGTLKPQASANSLRSRGSTGEPSDVENPDDPVVLSEQKEKRRLFGLSRKKDDQSHLGSYLTSPKKSIGSNGVAGKSSTSFSSSRGRKSLSGETAVTSTEPLPNMQPHSSIDSGSAGKEEKKGPFDWIKNKVREAKEEKREREAEKEKERVSKSASERGASTSTVGERRATSTDVQPELDGGTEAEPVPPTTPAPSATF